MPQSPANSQQSPTVPGSGGGTTPYTPLEASADPAAQSLTAGTTSSAGVTFTAPTGGSGSYTYSAALVQHVGTGATLSGSGLGPYTVSSLEDGDLVSIVLTSTDAGSVSQEVTNQAQVEVQTASTTPALVAPTVTEGLIQREASGTTTATVNVGAASGGGGGPYTYGSVSLDKPGGSSAAVSGTVPGALSVTGLDDNEAVVLSGTVTDPATSQVITWTHTVDVAALERLPVLVAPTVTEGAIQREASGTTSATINVGAASGGDGGPYTYSAPALDKPGGSSAAVSGTAPGTISVTGLADDEAVVVSGTVTDATTGQVVDWTHTVDVAASGGGGGASWVDIEDVDLTTVTNAGPFTASTDSYDFTGYTGVTGQTGRFSTNTGNVEAINGTGIVVTGVGGGTMRFGLTLTDIISAWNTQYARERMIAVHFVYDMTWGVANSSGPVVGFNNLYSHNSGSLRGIRFQRTSGGLEHQQVRYNNTGSTFETLGSLRTSGVVTLILQAGMLVEVMSTAGSTPPIPEPGGANTYQAGGDAVALLAPTVTYDPFLFMVGMIFDGAITMKRLLVQRLE